MDTHESELKIAEMEKDIESLVAMVSELYEKVHRVERVLVDEGTLETNTLDIDERGPEGLLAEATQYVTKTGKCSVSLLQKRFKITHKRAFALLDALEADGVIAPYRGEPTRVVNQ
jgi:S-DNA-T family DNA segregation ATPase FtsK/SpoIIIE